MKHIKVEIGFNLSFVLLAGLALAAVVLLSGCDADPAEEETIPLGLACDPDDVPDRIPGCPVCQGPDWWECCTAVPEQLACRCMDPRGSGDYKWFMGFCRGPEK